MFRDLRCVSLGLTVACILSLTQVRERSSPSVSCILGELWSLFSCLCLPSVLYTSVCFLSVSLSRPSNPQIYLRHNLLLCHRMVKRREKPAEGRRENTPGKEDDAERWTHTKEENRRLLVRARVSKGKKKSSLSQRRPSLLYEPQ